MAIEIIVRDTETGEEEKVEVKDWWLITVPPYHVVHQNLYINGTAQLTIKKGDPPA